MFLSAYLRMLEQCRLKADARTDSPDMFLDLHAAVSQLPPGSTSERVSAMMAEVPGANVVAVGGFPVVGNQWCGAPVSVERVRSEVLNGIGISAVLTHMNRSDLSLERLASICDERGHLWGYRWMTISILFVAYGAEAELAFARDTRFFLSWPIGGLGDVFVANGSIKDWIRFTANSESPDWGADARRAMGDAGNIVGALT